MPLQIDGATIGQVYLDGPIAEGWLWDGSAWAKVLGGPSVLGDAGMDKLGGFDPGATGARKITGWSARAGSAVVDDGLRVSGSGTAVVTGSANFTQVDYSDHYVMIYRNGQEIARSPSADRGTLSASVFVSLESGDVLELYAVSGTGSRASISASGTFLTVAARNFGAGRLTKVGDQALALSQFVRIRGWATEGELVEEDGGVIVPPGVAVTVTAVLDYIGQGTYNTSQQFRIMNGATELARASRSFTQSGPFSTSASFVGTGELLAIEGAVNQTSSSRNIVRAGTTTIAVSLD